MDIKQFASAIKQIAEEKGIPEDKIVETIEAAIAAAYKKDYGEKSQVIRAKMLNDGEKFDMTQVKYVIEGVDDEGFIVGELPNLSHLVEDRKEREEMRPERKSETRDRDNEVQEEEDTRVKFNPEKYITLEDAKKINKKLKVSDEVVTKLESKSDFGRIAAQTAKQVIIQRLREIERNIIFEELL